MTDVTPWVPPGSGAKGWNVPLDSKLTEIISSVNGRAPLASPTFTGTVSGITAAMVGADASGAASSAQAAAASDATNKVTAEATRATTAEGINAAAIAANSGLIAPLVLVPTAVKTANYTAAAQDLVLCDSTSGTFTVTLPAAPADKVTIEIKKIDTSSNAVSVVTGGSDVFNRAGGSTSTSLVLTGQSLTVRYQSATGFWIILGTDTPLGGLDSRFANLGAVLGVVAGETPTQTSTRIQAALDANSSVTLFGGDFLTLNALQLNSNQLLTIWNARIIRQDDGSTGPVYDTQIIRNKNINATGNSNIRIRGIGKAVLTVDPSLLTTAKRNPNATTSGRPDIWKNIGVAFVNCTTVRVTDVQIGPTNAFAGNQQLCTDVIWSGIELLQDASVVNQDGIDIGPGCSNITIQHVTGQTGDDFCSIYAQRTSGSIEQGYVKGYIDATPSRANITNIFVKNVHVSPGLTSGNMFRIQAGDGAQMTKLFVDSVEVLGSSALAFMQLGATTYVVTAPATTDFAGIEVRNVSGRFPRLLAIDSPCSNISFTDVAISGGTLTEAIGYTGATAAASNNISIDGLRGIPTTAGGMLVHLRPGAATTNVSVKNAYLGWVTAILKDEYGNTGIHLSDIKIATLAGVPLQVLAATAGTVDDVAWDSTSTGFTGAVMTGTAPALILGPNMPTFTSADVTPSPILGSWLRCDGSKVPDAGTAAPALYMGSGTAWIRITTLGGDVTAPSTPGTPVATAGAAQNTLTWTASTDNIAVTGYRIYRSDASTVVLGTSATNSYTDTTPASGTAYTYTVAAFDAAGNASAKSASSNSVTATTVTFSLDTFTRAAAATNPGSTETGAFAWTSNISGDTTKWGISSSNTLQKPAGQAPTAPKELLIDDGHSDGTILATFVSGLTSTSGVAFRVSADGSTGLMLQRNASGAYLLQSRAATTYTTIATLLASGGAANDAVKIVLSGSSISCFVNGSQIGTTQTSTIGQSNTRHGLWAGADANTTSFDNWSHTN